MSTSPVKCEGLWEVSVFMSWRGPSWQTRTPSTRRFIYCLLCMGLQKLLITERRRQLESTCET